MREISVLASKAYDTRLKTEKFFSLVFTEYEMWKACFVRKLSLFGCYRFLRLDNMIGNNFGFDLRVFNQLHEKYYKKSKPKIRIIQFICAHIKYSFMSWIMKYSNYLRVKKNPAKNRVRNELRDLSHGKLFHLFILWTISSSFHVTITRRIKVRTNVNMITVGTLDS